MRQFKAMKKKIGNSWGVVGYTWPFWNGNSEGVGRTIREGGGGGFGYFLESHIKVIKVNFVKNDECAKNSSRVWPNIQMRWQKVGCWQLAIFRKMTLCEGGEFSNNSFEVCQNSNDEMTNEACWLLAISTKMTNLAKIANLARSN